MIDLYFGINVGNLYAWVLSKYVGMSAIDVASFVGEIVGLSVGDIDEFELCALDGYTVGEPDAFLVGTFVGLVEEIVKLLDVIVGDIEVVIALCVAGSEGLLVEVGIFDVIIGDTEGVWVGLLGNDVGLFVISVGIYVGACVELIDALSDRPILGWNDGDTFGILVVWEVGIGFRVGFNECSFVDWNVSNIVELFGDLVVVLVGVFDGIFGGDCNGDMVAVSANALAIAMHRINVNVFQNFNL